MKKSTTPPKSASTPQDKRRLTPREPRRRTEPEIDGVLIVRIWLDAYGEPILLEEHEAFAVLEQLQEFVAKYREFFPEP